MKMNEYEKKRINYGREKERERDVEDTWRVYRPRSNQQGRCGELYFPANESRDSWTTSIALAVL